MADKETSTKYRVMTDWLEKVTKRDSDGKLKETKMYRKGKIVDYSDDPERAEQLLALGAIASVDTEVSETPMAVNAVHDTSNGGASGGQAVPGPAFDSPVAVPGPSSGQSGE